MAKPIPIHEHEAMLDAIGQFPGGAGIEQIEATLTAPPTRRTLQRWLTDLIAQGRARTCHAISAWEHRPCSRSS